MQGKDIFEFITSEEAEYKTRQIMLADGWTWNMHEHIRRSTLYKNSKFSEGDNDGNRPFNNIVRPIVNVAYRTEGLDVKDIEPFVDNPDNYYKSFLVRRYHGKWALWNNIDTFIDEGVESFVDYGLWLAKNDGDAPSTVPLQRIAFCDQTNILGGPICEKHNYTIDEMVDMANAGSWDKNGVEMAITYSNPAVDPVMSQGGQENKTPGKYIEIYELHGVFPISWLNDKDQPETEEQKNKYSRQMHIVTFCASESGKNGKQGITLFKGKERKPIYKALKRDKIFGRACGTGGIEELFDPQQWANYDEIRIKDMLDAAALLILQTASPDFENKNVTVSDLVAGRVLYNGGDPITQVSITPQNIEKFWSGVDRWKANAQELGSANDPVMGKTPNSGTPFKLQELVTVEGKGDHEYRRGKIAVFLAEIYRDWVLPKFSRDLSAGATFSDMLSLDELLEVSEAVVTNRSNAKIKDSMLKRGNQARVPRPDEIEALRTITRENFMSGGKNRFLEIFKDEMKSLPVDVRMNIAGKQKDLARVADALTNIFRQIIAAPQILEQAGMGKLFNEIIEASGFSPVDFTGLTRARKEIERQSGPEAAEPTPLAVA